MRHLAFLPLLAVAVGGVVLTPAVAAPPPNVPDAAQDVTAKGEQTAVFAGGCFWGVEAVFDHLKGVKSATSGFAGGKKSTAHYEEVSTGSTGHAESVQVVYDPAQITYGQLLKVFFAVAHDPTELNRQGPDTGTQYRSAIFYTTEEEKTVAEAYIAQLNQAKVFRHKIVTQVVPLKGFYPAEEYHQHFVQRNPDYPYVVYNDLPKLRNLMKQYPQLCKR